MIGWRTAPPSVEHCLLAAAGPGRAGRQSWDSTSLRGCGTGSKLWREAAIQNSPGLLALGEATIKCALKVATEGVAARVKDQ